MTTPLETLNRKHVVAIDGLPASPAMAAALEAINAAGLAVRERDDARKRHDSDPRVIALRAARKWMTTEYRYGTPGAERLFDRLGTGRIAKMAQMTRLVRARLARLDGNKHLRADMVREAIVCRQEYLAARRTDKAEGYGRDRT